MQKKRRVEGDLLNTLNIQNGFPEWQPETSTSVSSWDSGISFCEPNRVKYFVVIMIMCFSCGRINLILPCVEIIVEICCVILGVRLPFCNGLDK